MKKFESQLRLYSGVILTVYVVQHLINHAFGIVSFASAEWFRLSVSSVFQTWPGQVLLYGAFSLHAGLSLRVLYLKSSLRMPAWEWAQLSMGLAIFPLLAAHVIGTRGLHIAGDIDPDYEFVAAALLYDVSSLVKLAMLLPIVWGHAVIGLHFWLRLKPRYPVYLPYLYAAAVLIPALAVAGIFNMLREAADWMADDARLADVFAGLLAMNPGLRESVLGLEPWVLGGMAISLAAVLLARQLRLWFAMRKGTFRVSHSSGHVVRAQIGKSLLDTLRGAGIPHASVCGGRARCTTCRVRVGSGLSELAPADELESRALVRIGAPVEVRLACQLHPQNDLAITPLVDPRHSTASAVHAGGVHGREEQVVAMFVDMRGSTSMGERVLAYDVVFILNRFFTELSLALEETHGHYAQFAGDGLMALYGIGEQRKATACRDALHGARVMFQRLARLNEQMQSEFGETIKMGIGIHGGEAIVGAMGPPKTPLLTAVGDNINIAARLEAQTKALGCDIVISVETLRAENIQHAHLEMRDVPVRGRQEDVAVCMLQASTLGSIDV